MRACGREITLDAQAIDPGASLDRQDLLKGRRTRLFAAAAARGVSNLRVFGSAARGEATGGSDIDLLVDLAPERTLIDLAAFRDDAADILGVPVDVATLDLLKDHIRDEVVRVARAI